MQTLLQDLRFSIRTLRRSPGFALTAILTLALGVASVTSVFSVVNSVLLKPFAFPESNRLVVLRETTRELNYAAYPDNYKHYLNWKANSKTLADAAIFRNNTFSVSSGTDHPKPSKVTTTSSYSPGAPGRDTSQEMPAQSVAPSTSEVPRRS